MHIVSHQQYLQSTNISNVNYLHLLATVKLSVLLAVLLRHITVVSFLMNILDAVTRRVEVKLAFRGVPLTLMRETVSGSRFKIIGGVSSAAYEVNWVMSGLRHSRADDLNTWQVNVTWSPGHVNCLVLSEVSSTLSAVRRWWRLDICLASNHDVANRLVTIHVN